MKSRHKESDTSRLKRMLSEMAQAGMKETKIERAQFENLWKSEKPYNKEIGSSLLVCGVMVYPRFYKPAAEKFKINFGDE